jgi:transposase
LRALAHERHRFGYCRLHILLKREGIFMNIKKTYRLYTSEGLSVKKRKGRKHEQLEQELLLLKPLS